MNYSTVFGGSTIYPAEPNYLALSSLVDVDLLWPLEQALNGFIFAKIIDITASAPGLDVSLPDATLGSLGYVGTINNLTANTVNILNFVGGAVVSLAPGDAWSVYLADNTTSAGVWRAYQAGAGTSTANAAALAGAGLLAISTTLNEKMDVIPVAVNSAIVNGNRAQVIEWTGAVGALTLPDPAIVGANWFVTVKNNGSGSITVTPAAGTIDSSANLVMATLESAFIVSDGANYITVGFGQSNDSIFDFISIPVAGTGNFTLTGSQLNRVAYEFTGILTGNRTIIVPSAIQQYWVTNHTTGAFTLTVKTAAGTGVVVAQNTRAILYCDGTNVVNADDASSIAFPILPTQGGTGLAAYAQGDILYASAANTLAALAKSGTATRYLANTGASNSPAWDQVNLTNGVTGILPSANLVTSGNFSANVTGCSGSPPSRTIEYRIIGNWCILRLTGASLVGASSSVSCTITFLPAACIPTVNSLAPCLVQNNGVGLLAGYAQFGAASSIIALRAFNPANGQYDVNGFANTGANKGLQQDTVIAYPLS